MTGLAVFKSKLISKFVQVISKTPFRYFTGVLLFMLIKARDKLLPIRWQESDSVVVLGKGRSLKRVVHFPNDIQDYIVANFTNAEFSQEFIKSRLKNKRIIMMANICENIISPMNVLRYRIEKCQFTRLKANGTQDPLREKRKHKHVETIGLKMHYLPERLEKDAINGNNTGMIAIVYAVKALKKKNVYLAGFDFYEDDYLTGSLLEHMKTESNVEHHRKAGEKMKNFLVDFISNHHQTRFYIISNAKFGVKLDNVILIDRLRSSL